MPEATILYSVTGVVVAGLVVWVAMVLATAKQPWVRPVTAEEAAAMEEEEPAAALVTPETPLEPTSSPDDTARQTPVALSTGRAKAASVETKAAAAELEAEKEAETKAGSS